MPRRTSPTGNRLAGCAGLSILFVFSGMFLVIGLISLFTLTILPLWLQQQAKSWKETPCVIRDIGVKVNDGSDGDTFEPRVLYEYTFEGRAYTGKEFWFGDVSDGNRSAVEEAIAKYQVGGESICYVNPKKPSQAILEPTVAKGILIGMIVGGLFSLFGLGGCYGAVYAFRHSNGTKKVERPAGQATVRSASPALGLMSSPSNSSAVQSGDGPTYYQNVAACPMEGEAPDEPLVLKQSFSRTSGAIAAWVFALIWNGFIGTFFVLAMGKMPWFPVLILSIFAVIGIGILFYACRKTLQIFNPRTTVVCSQRYLYPLSEFEVSWMQQGKSSRIRKLKITLQGSESVSYRQGTTTRTEENKFYEKVIVETTEASEIAQGFSLVQLTEDTMHSFKANRNSVVWKIQVHGDIAYWPDIEDDYEITIYPPLIAQADHATN
jgi:hypothetical protein